MAERKRRQLGPRQPFSGRFDDSRIVWASLFSGMYLIYRNPTERPDTDPGDDVTLSLAGPKRPVHNIRLTDHTYGELETLKEVLDIAFELALPVALKRDEVAKEEYDAGNDSLQRLYRGIPELFMRQRLEREYNPRIRLGSARISPLGNGPATEHNRPGPPGQEMVEGKQVKGSTEDNGSPPDSTENVRQVDGTGDSEGLLSTDTSETSTTSDS